MKCSCALQIDIPYILDLMFSIELIYIYNLRMYMFKPSSKTFQFNIKAQIAKKNLSCFQLV
jgi:hypothetical protein